MPFIAVRHARLSQFVDESDNVHFSKCLIMQKRLSTSRIQILGQRPVLTPCNSAHHSGSVSVSTCRVEVESHRGTVLSSLI